MSTVTKSKGEKLFLRSLALLTVVIVLCVVWDVLFNHHHAIDEAIHIVRPSYYVNPAVE